MAEEQDVELDLIQCAAFPGLSFAIEPGRDALGLIAKNHANNTYYTLLQLVRNFGTIERPGNLPADFPGLPGRRGGKIPTTEELAAEQLLVGRDANRAPPEISPEQFTLGGGPVSHLNFFLRRHDRDGIQLLCESRETPGDNRTVLLGLTSDGYLNLYRAINERQRRFTGLRYDTNARLALPPTHNHLVPHPTLTGLSLYMEPDFRTGSVIIVGCDNQHGCFTVASVTREGRLNRPDGVELPSLKYSPGTNRIEDDLSRDIDRDRAESIVHNCYVLPKSGIRAERWEDLERLPTEAAKYNPCAGEWHMKTMKDGRRRFYLTSQSLKDCEAEGSTAFFLPAAVTLPTQEVTAPVAIISDHYIVFTHRSGLPPLSLGGGPADDGDPDLGPLPLREEDFDLDREEEDPR